MRQCRKSSMKDDGLFGESLLTKVQESFAYLHHDPDFGERIFFDNSGGALRLKKAIEEKQILDMFPDCTERTHQRAQKLQLLIEQVTDEILQVMFKVKEGSLITGISASQVMFKAVEAALINRYQGNVVTTNLEHPSSYDAVVVYCRKQGIEVREAKADIMTGFINPESVLELVNQDTILVNVVGTSNLTGTVLDTEGIFRQVRHKNPETLLFTDCVQQAPHNVVDVSRLGADYVSFAPYKCGASRGIGIAYASKRLSALNNQRLIGKPEGTWDLGSLTPSLYQSVHSWLSYICWIGSNLCQSSVNRDLFQAGMGRIHQHETGLLDRLLNGSETIPGLRAYDDIYILGDDAPLTNRDLIVSFNVQGIPAREIVQAYEKQGIIVAERSTDSIYARRQLKAFLQKDAIRVSPFHCHGLHDIDVFLEITSRILGL